MNIFNHLLPPTAILGIGPLMVEHHPDPAELNLYGTRRYFFDLHLSAHTTQIKSDWFQPADNKDQQDLMKQWRLEYQVLRLKVAAMMGESDEMKAAAESFQALVLHYFPNAILDGQLQS